mmetsp:Transcript_22737/g.65537  ORF Transcript_22737/g.65537 Transcript_22737/m.65537 type:complete len:166 (-) Transcript_22737:602-1099(-)
MHQLTINVGFGFVFGILLCASALLVVVLLIARRVFTHLQARDLSADRKSVVDIIATFVADVMAHPKVVDALSVTIATGINRWITSTDSQEALRQVYAKAPRSEAVREIGKEVPMYVKNFGLGVVDAMTFRGGNSKDSKKGIIEGDDGDGDTRSKKEKSNVHSKKE